MAKPRPLSDEQKQQIAEWHNRRYELGTASKLAARMKLTYNQVRAHLYKLGPVK
jgi:transposase